MVKKTAFFLIHSLVFFCFFSFLFILVFAGYIAYQDKKIGNTIYPNVYIDNKPFGGKQKADINVYMQEKQEDAQKLNVTLLYQDNPIASISAEDMNIHYDTQSVADKAHNIGRNTDWKIRVREKISSVLGVTRYDIATDISYDLTPIQKIIDDTAVKNNIPPQDALFKFENGRVTAFKIETEGREVNKVKAISELNQQLMGSIGKPKHIIIPIQDSIITPAITLKDINEFGITEKIGEGLSDYTGSIPNRIHNLLLASSKLDGIIIPAGSTFSFNANVGEISSRTGYKPAYVISGGRTVLGDGGGVCQVSTTLFRAALNTGLAINERRAHAYRVHYYENDQKPGLDATVYAPSVDLKFTNNTSSAILIQRLSDTTNRKLGFVLYGKKDNRIVEQTPIQLSNVRSAPAALYQDDPTLKKGIVKQVDWAAPGTTSSFHYRVIKDDEILSDQEFISNYRPWQAVFLVGTAD